MKLGLAVFTAHSTAPVQVPNALFQIKISANAPGKTAGDSPNPWATATIGEMGLEFLAPGVALL